MEKLQLPPPHDFLNHDAAGVLRVISRRESRFNRHTHLAPTDLLRLALVRALALLINATEVRHNDRYGQCDDEHPTQ